MSARISAAARRYGRRIWPATLSYVVLLAVAIWALNAHAVGGALRYAIALLPAIPLVG